MILLISNILLFNVWIRPYKIDEYLVIDYSSIDWMVVINCFKNVIQKLDLNETGERAIGYIGRGNLNETLEPIAIKCGGNEISHATLVEWVLDGIAAL